MIKITEEEVQAVLQVLSGLPHGQVDNLVRFFRSKLMPTNGGPPPSSEEVEDVPGTSAES